MSADHRRISTPRLRLEPVPPATARALLAGSPVPGLLAGRGWPHADTLAGLAADAEAAPDRTGWLIVLRSTSAVIGDCGWRGGPDPDGEVEIGYGLAAPFRGQGYGTEAVRALVDWCAGQLGVRRLIAEVLPGNVPSRRVLESVGFALSPPPPGGDHARYARPPVIGT